MNSNYKCQDLKDRARACKTPEELLALAKEEGIELTDEQLEDIAGGGWGQERHCPRCKSTNIELAGTMMDGYFRCKNCGTTWRP